MAEWQNGSREAGNPCHGYLNLSPYLPNLERASEVLTAVIQPPADFRKICEPEKWNSLGIIMVRDKGGDRKAYRAEK